MKKWYQSKTVIFNSIMTLVMIAQLVGQTNEELAGVTALVAGIGNIIIRVWYTDTAVERSIS